MTKVWVVTAEHFRIPGMHLSVWSSEDGAKKKALQIVNKMLEECEEESTADWEEGREKLKDLNGFAQVEVDVTGCEVQVSSSIQLPG